MPGNGFAAYALASLLAILVSFLYTRSHLRNGPVAQQLSRSHPKLGSVARFLPGGFLALLTTVGTYLLGYYGLEQVGPELGVAWVAGLAVGGLGSYFWTVRHLVHTHAGDIRPDDLHSVKSLAISALHTSDLETAAARVAAKVTELKERDRRDLDRLEESLAKTRSELARLEEYSQLVGGVLQLASAGGFGGWDKQNASRFMKSTVDQAATILNKEGPTVVAVYFNFQHESDEVHPFVASNPVASMTDVNLPLSSRNSLLEAVIRQRVVIHWPNDKNKPWTKRLDKKPPKSAHKNWPKGIAFPIPLPQHGLPPEATPPTYGMIIARCNSGRRFDQADRDFLSALAALIDTVVTLSGVLNSLDDPEHLADEQT